MIKPPCKGCEKRHPACHDRCSEYQAYKVKTEAARLERERLYGGEAAEYERMAYIERKNWRRR